TLRRQNDKLREDSGRLASAMRQQLLQHRNALQRVASQLLQQSPALSVQRSIGRLVTLRQRLGTSALKALGDASHRIALLGRALNSVSPLATLDRGYAIVQDEASGRVLTRASDVTAGNKVRARLSEGELVATVNKVIRE
ncbi:MAG TPA: exodeoxyribonuclease VII large subunit, partial [Woeseiaceae bacterium]|nr:exodeoxyribonuclease VII large subunit [Woeseiaceae bacterium]